ncbi:hypothetical protein N7463_003876 [Penicillium fimorum]|uniref:Nucleoside phosphorylase domain-containing protein n=1 Tax=Penicillium fimorum TaxID=1882269 RepID=A0A9X0CAA5_9EURO|nr:hypothetical protein N7463_003876 [Penicillium fimorum]
MRPKSRKEFTIAIICALPVEADAMEALFDETYDRFGRLYGKQPGDTNAYVNGRIGKHNVVLCYLPGMGKESAASVASTLCISYTEIQIALVVGICGGAPWPSPIRQIYLGDVVISDSVVAYDFGRQYPGGFRRKTNVKDILGRPNQEVRSLLTGLKASRSQSEFQHQMLLNLHSLQQSETRWHHPGFEDILFEASYLHKHHAQISPSQCGCSIDNSPYNICDEALEIECHDLRCDTTRVIRQRSGTTMTKASVHIGTIASADTVMKSGEHRDAIIKEERVLGFEMEAAGVWDNISCVIVKGVCDYADSHKTKIWQCYAAATGASAAKAFLEYWKPISKDDIMTDNEIEHLACLSPNYPANDENTQRKRTVRDTKSKGNNLNRASSSDGLDALYSAHKSGVSLCIEGEHKRAEKLFRTVLECLKEALGTTHADTLDSMHWLGRSLFLQGKYTDAENALRKASDEQETTLGPVHKDTLYSVYWLGRSLFLQGKYTDAEDALQKAAGGQEITLGSFHEDTLFSIHWLGCSLYTQEKYIVADKMLRKAADRQEITLGPIHKDTLYSIYWLGRSQFLQGKYTDAEDALRKATDRQEITLGPIHEDTLYSVHWLGRSLFLQGKYTDADDALRKAADGQETTLGPIHKDTLYSFHWLGRSLFLQGKYTDAEDALQKAADGQDITLGPVHKDTLDSIYWLGHCRIPF